MSPSFRNVTELFTVTHLIISHVKISSFEEEVNENESIKSVEKEDHDIDAVDKTQLFTKFKKFPTNETTEARG